MDSSVLLHVSTQDPVWLDWSAAALGHAVRSGPVLINPIIHAEVSVGYERVEDLDDALPAETSGGSLCPSWPDSWPVRPTAPTGGAATYAPRHFRTLFIGVHAAVSGFALLTRDAGRYRTYFPSVEVIAP